MHDDRIRRATARRGGEVAVTRRMSSVGAHLTGPMNNCTQRSTTTDTSDTNHNVDASEPGHTLHTGTPRRSTTHTRQVQPPKDQTTPAPAVNPTNTNASKRRQRVKHRRAQPTFVQELHERHRWKREGLPDQQGWRMWYREHDNTWQPRYEIRRSDLMMHVSGGDKLEHDDMYGLYASRRYDSGEAITVYVGHDIGAADGNEDDYKAYRTIERDAAPWTDTHGRIHQGNGGRHVMQVGSRLVDGQRDGYTGAQYANSAYRVPLKWTNKAELKAGGTIRVMHNKIIYPGEEILFAYHTEYWKRWGMVSKRGRKAKLRDTTQAQSNQKTARVTTTTMAEAQTATLSQDVAATMTSTPRVDTHTCEQPSVHTEEWTADVGTRIIPATVNSGRATGRGKGKGKSQASRMARTELTTVRKRSVKQYQWSTVGRDAFNVAQTSTSNRTIDSSGSHGNRFERGEGGGVT